MNLFINKKQEIITSYGIILTHTDSKGDIFYLLSRRRDTVEYSDFINGIYLHSNLKNYFKLMTIEERERIINHSFEELWNDIRLNKSNDIYKQKAVEKFISNYNYIKNLLQTTVSIVKEPEWGFPKGKRKYNENEIKCAFREFKEESNLNIKYSDLLPLKPVKEIFKGSNGKIYSTVYFICNVKEKLKFTKMKLDGIRSETISEEISKLNWCTLEESIKMLPFFRKKLLINLEQELRK